MTRSRTRIAAGAMVALAASTAWALNAAAKAATLAKGDEAEKLQAAAEYYRRELERRRSDPAAKL